MKTAAPEQKSVKTLKGQLFGAVAMMLVASIALGTSTYAWFVNNSTVKVDNMQLTVSSSEYLEIAIAKKAGGGYSTYKNLLSNDDIKGTADGQAGWTNMFSAEKAYQMVPASTITAVTDDTFYKSLGDMVDTNLSTFGKVTTAEIGEGAIKKLPLSFRSSVDTNVYFGGIDAATMDKFVTAVSGVDNGTVQAAAIAKALRIAVVPKDGDAVVFQFSEDTTNGTYNTLYPTTGDTIGAAISNNDGTGTYRAVLTVDDTEHTIKTTGEQKAQLTTNDYLATVTASTSGGAPTVAVTEDSIPLFALTANEAKDVAVYIWLEGVDQHCTVDLANYTFNLALPFAAKTAEAPAP